MVYLCFRILIMSYLFFIFIFLFFIFFFVLYLLFLFYLVMFGALTLFYYFFTLSFYLIRVLGPFLLKFELRPVEGHFRFFFRSTFETQLQARLRPLIGLEAFCLEQPNFVLVKAQEVAFVFFMTCKEPSAQSRCLHESHACSSRFPTYGPPLV